MLMGQCKYNKSTVLLIPFGKDDVRLLQDQDIYEGKYWYREKE